MSFRGAEGDLANVSQNRLLKRTNEAGLGDLRPCRILCVKVDLTPAARGSHRSL